MGAEAGRKTSQRNRNPGAGRIVAVIAVLVLVALMLGVRLVYAHIAPDDRVLNSVVLPLRISELQAPRGTIVDRTGRVLAFSVPAVTVIADPRQIDNPAQVAARLSPLLGEPADELFELLSSQRHYARLARQLDVEVGEKVTALGIPGVYIEEEFRREYPNGPCSALSVVGTVNTDNHGRAGLEETHDEWLSGIPGEIAKEVGTDGTTIPGGFVAINEAVPGDDLTLTIDRNVQFQAEQLLIDAVGEAEAEEGVALVALPATGEIVAMANVARGSDGIVACTRTNLAAVWTYEPGSVLKPVTMAAAFAGGAVTPDSQVQVPSGITVHDHWFEDDPWHPEVLWRPTDILSRSSNVGAIRLAQMTGDESLHAMLTRFGLGSRTAVNFKGESKGILHPLNEWNLLSLPTHAIGQGVSVTPLQMVQVYNTIANNGVMMPLRVVAGDEDRDAEEHRPTAVIEPSVAGSLQAMLTAAVSDGTGRLAALTGFTMAGKTGTAWQPCDVGYECVDENGELVGRHHTATFAGIVSNADGPALVVLVVIDDPNGAQVSGGRLSAPLVGRLAEYALRQLRIPAISEDGPEQRRRAEPAPAPLAPTPESVTAANIGNAEDQ